MPLANEVFIEGVPPELGFKDWIGISQLEKENMGSGRWETDFKRILKVVAHNVFGATGGVSVGEIEEYLGEMADEAG